MAVSRSQRKKPIAPYKKGIETKARIYNSTKKMFTLYGYKEATIQRIADDSKVPLGLVNYYFKKNEALALAMKEFNESIKKLIRETLAGNYEDPLTEHILFSRIFFDVVLSNKNSKRLYNEIYTEELIGIEEYDLDSGMLAAIISSFDIDITESLFRRLAIAEYGARRELLEDRYDRLNPKTSVDFINFLATISVRLAGVDIKSILNCVKKANDIFDKTDTSKLRFLNWE